MSFFDATNNIGRFDTKHGDGFIIHFVHVATHDTAHFKAFLTSWEDQLKQNWKSYETVGRMDPIMIYARTGRQINFSIEIPSVSEEEALLNMVQIERMMRMCYPTFEGAVERKETSTQIIVDSETAEKNRKAREEQEARTIFATENPDKDFDDPSNSPQKQVAEQEAKKKIESELTLKDYEQQVITGKITSPTVPVSRQVSFFSRTASTMVSPPLMRIKFANWVSDTNIDKDYSTSADHGTTGPSGESGAGLYGVIENVKFAPDLSENGGFYACKAYGESEKSYLIPKLLKLDIMFTVLHASDLGYNSSTRDLRTSGFPYNAEKIYNEYQARKNFAEDFLNIAREDTGGLKEILAIPEDTKLSSGIPTIPEPLNARPIKEDITEENRKLAQKAIEELGLSTGDSVKNIFPRTTLLTNQERTIIRSEGVAGVDTVALGIGQPPPVAPSIPPSTTTGLSTTSTDITVVAPALASNQNTTIKAATDKILSPNPTADAQNQQRQEKRRQDERARERRVQERQQRAEQTRAEAERQRDPVGSFFKGLFGQRQ